MPSFNPVSWVRQCFPRHQSVPADDLEKANLSQVDNRPTIIKSCPFCDVSTEKGFNIVWEDDTFVAFQDRNPSSTIHVQLITKRHIGSVKELTKADVELLTSMADHGHEILDKAGAPSDPSLRRLGFHIPPLNSVQHLHMHTQALPYKSWLRAKKYPVVTGSNGNTKGFSWFVTIDQAIEILDTNKQIGIFPC
ncbi:hypothetical protein PM082_002003 [Marasmius tenuissimus]|nr:hypothetical protein PM082_002003 [Marasmius tenuissimus]